MWFLLISINIERLTPSPTCSGCGLKQEAVDIPFNSLVTQTNLSDNSILSITKRWQYFKLA